MNFEDISQPQIILASLTLQDSGTYNQQYVRSYEVNTTGEKLDILGRKIEEVTHMNPAAKISAGVLSGISGGLIAPAANWDHAIMVPNGWAEKRFRFSLEVHVSTYFGTEIYYFQGFSEAMDITLQGTINPKLTFFINSYLKIQRSNELGHLGAGGFSDRILESAQVINGRFHVQPNSQSVYGLRPEDIFTGVQSGYMKAGYDIAGAGQVMDDRINKSNDIFRSSRANGIPSNFLSKTVSGYRDATILADYGSDTEDITSRCIGNVHEGGVYQNPLIRALSNITGIPDTTYFTLEMLSRIDPTINQRTTYHRMLDTVRLHQAGDTNNNWGDATIETQMACILANAVSGLMLETMLVAVGFTTTNMTVNGMYDTRFMPGGQAVTTADMRQYFGIFQLRLETEVLPDLTQNNMIPISLSVNADLYGETVMHISVAGAPTETFVTPSFCDALMAPIVTTNQDCFNTMLTGIETVVNHCSLGSNSYMTGDTISHHV